MSKMSKFTDIGQFRNVVHNIRKKTEYAGKDENGDAIYNTIEEGGYPTIKFLATEKLHGTNASVVFSNDEIYAQSRTRILGRNSDNAGFASFVMNTKEVWEKVQQTFKAIINDNDKFIIYGEWCGGSIQKGMGINKLEKMFVIFAMKIVSSNPDIELCLFLPFSMANNNIIAPKTTPESISLKTENKKNMGLYLKAVSKDIMKEEEDILSELGIEWKLVNKAIMNIAKKYYVERLNKEMGL